MVPPTPTLPPARVDQAAARNLIQQLCNVLGVDLTVPPAPQSTTTEAKTDNTEADVKPGDEDSPAQKIAPLPMETAAAVQNLLSAASLVNGTSMALQTTTANSRPSAPPSTTSTPNLRTPRLPPAQPATPASTGPLVQYVHTTPRNSTPMPPHLPPTPLPQHVYPVLNQGSLTQSRTMNHRIVSSAAMPTSAYPMTSTADIPHSNPVFPTTSTPLLLPSSTTNRLPSTSALPPPPPPPIIPSSEHPPAILSSSPDGIDASLAQRIFVERAVVVECGDEVLEAKAAVARAAVHWFSQNRGSLRTCRGGLGGTQTRFDINCGVQTASGRCKLSVKFAFLTRSRRRSRSCMNVRFVADHSCTAEESAAFLANAPMRVRRAHLTRTQFVKLERKPAAQAISKHQARRLASDTGKRGRKSLVPQKYTDDLRRLILHDVREKTATILARLRNIHCVDGKPPEDWPGDVRILSKITRIKRTLRD